MISQSSTFHIPGFRGEAIRSSGSMALLFCLMLSGVSSLFSQEDPPPPAQKPSPQRKGPKLRVHPELSEEDMLKVREIIHQLRKGFLKGDVQTVMSLFGDTENSKPNERLKEIRTALTQEFKNERYHSFEILGEIQPDDKIAPNRHSVWVRLHYSISEKTKSSGGDPKSANFIRETSHNDIFIFKLRKDGRFRLLDSPFFDTLGRRLPYSDTLGKTGQFFKFKNLPYNIFLGGIGLLSLMFFWVWMGFQAYIRRPRSSFWRVFVLLPIIGATSYFFVVYVPDWWKPDDSKV